MLIISFTGTMTTHQGQASLSMDSEEHRRRGATRMAQRGRFRATLVMSLIVYYVQKGRTCAVGSRRHNQGQDTRLGDAQAR
jgi:hypothetical protein